LASRGLRGFERGVPSVDVPQKRVSEIQGRRTCAGGRKCTDSASEIEKRKQGRLTKKAAWSRGLEIRLEEGKGSFTGKLVAEERKCSTKTEGASRKDRDKNEESNVRKKVIGTKRRKGLEELILSLSTENLRMGLEVSGWERGRKGDQKDGKEIDRENAHRGDKKSEEERKQSPGNTGE